MGDPAEEDGGPQRVRERGLRTLCRATFSKGRWQINKNKGMTGTRTGDTQDTCIALRRKDRGNQDEVLGN